ncbi:MAG: protein kinase domain-containing protein [Planctomycetota bacterium]|jgi:Tol biopolymer transport system component
MSKAKEQDDKQPEDKGAGPTRSLDGSTPVPGNQIGPFRIEQELGRGGAGVVYLAHDTKLDRSVAIKSLPPEVKDNPKALSRFTREARVLASLNHPNIAAIHEELEEAEGAVYLVLEYVPGQTLAERIAKGPLKLEEALTIALQIAEAVAAAHEHDVIHRDLKPGNIKITQEGKVKVLDFGLAKVVGGETTDQQTTITEPGRVIGTPAYMSPEQARGKPTDKRSDIWSFGCVLYEMLTGNVPFKGETISDTLANILQTEPSWETLSESTPANIVSLLRRCLEKEPRRRLRDIGDIAITIEGTTVDLRRSTLPTETVGTEPVRPVKWSRRLLPWFITGVAVAVALGLLIGATMSFCLRPKPKPALRTVPFTSLSGREVSPVFSRNGDQIVFAWRSEESDNWDIFVQQVGTGARLQLTEHPGDDLSPTWSPDGQEIAFIRRDEGFIRWGEGQRRIFKVDVLGQDKRQLHSPTYGASTAGGDFDWSDGGLDWSADGRFLAFSERSAPGQPASIVLLSVQTRKTRQLTSPAPPSLGDRDPAFSPDGQTLAFIQGTNDNVDDIFIVPVAGGQPRRLTFDQLRVQSLDWTADGREILFSSNRGGTFSLWRISASGGQPEPLAGVGEGALDPTIPGQGKRLAYTQQVNLESNIWRMELPKPSEQAKAPTKFISSTRLDMLPEYSPDGQSIAFSSRRSGSSEIWRCDSDGSHPIRLTFFGGPEGGAPRWSPDGRQIAFDSRPEGHTDIYVVSLEGGPLRRLTAQSSDDWVPSWSRDGRWIYFTSNRGGDPQIWKMPAEGGQAVQVTKQGGFFALESPDSQFVYYTKKLGDNPALWRVPVDGGEEAPVHDLVKPADFGQWTVVDEGIYFVNATEPSSPIIEFFDFATNQVRSIATLEKPTIVGLAVSPDGRWILYTQIDRADSDIMLVENFR